MADEQGEGGLGRRDLIKRGAILGGALVWTTPVVQSLASPAFAQATTAGERCSFILANVVFPGGSASCFLVTNADPSCCAALTEANSKTDAVARFLALIAALAGPCNDAAVVECTP